jgi:hypothetical protein
MVAVMFPLLPSKAGPVTTVPGPANKLPPGEGRHSFSWRKMESGRCTASPVGPVGLQQLTRG